MLVKFQPFHNLNVNQKFKLFCYLLDGVGPNRAQPINTVVRFEWAKNGQILHSSSKYRIDMMNDESFFTIDKLSISDSGNYSCTVRNQFGTDVQYTQLTVKGLIWHFFSFLFFNLWPRFYSSCHFQSISILIATHTYTHTHTNQSIDIHIQSQGTMSHHSYFLWQTNNFFFISNPCCYIIFLFLFWIQNPESRIQFHLMDSMLMLMSVCFLFIM